MNSFQHPDRCLLRINKIVVRREIIVRMVRISESKQNLSKTVTLLCSLYSWEPMMHHDVMMSIRECGSQKISYTSSVLRRLYFALCTSFILYFVYKYIFIFVLRKIHLSPRKFCFYLHLADFYHIWFLPNQNVCIYCQAKRMGNSNLSLV